MQGQLHFDAQKYELALECFAQAAEIRPDNDSYHMRRYISTIYLQVVRPSYCCFTMEIGRAHV